jgi:hypothetical protein
MEKEWIYCFRKSGQAKQVLSDLKNAYGTDAHLGLTFPSTWNHTCFKEKHCSILEQRLASNKDVEYQTLIYFSGNIFPEDVGIRTFSQPYVQWCPCSIYSIEFEQDINLDSPWGLTMEGYILFPESMRSFLAMQITGLEKISDNVIGAFDAYQILGDAGICPDLPDDNEEPLTVDFNNNSAPDILRTNTGVLLCSLALARILKPQWDGFVYAKFQPITCLGVSRKLKKQSKRKLCLPKNEEMIQSLLDEIHVIEQFIGCDFPKEYATWISQSGGLLPMGWLSPIGGEKSPLALCIKQEQHEAEPAMPENLIPIYAYGDGNYICIDTASKRYVKWDHEKGTSSRLDEQRIPAILESISE